MTQGFQVGNLIPHRVRSQRNDLRCTADHLRRVKPFCCKHALGADKSCDGQCAYGEILDGQVASVERMILGSPAYPPAIKLQPGVHDSLKSFWVCLEVQVD